MNYPKKLYERLMSVKHISSMMPLLYRKNETVGVCKNGALVSVIKVQGADYTGMSSAKYDEAFVSRKRMFELEKDFIRIDTLSRKFRAPLADKFQEPKNSMQGKLLNAWKPNFDVLFRTHHFVVVTVHSGGFLAKIGGKLANEYNIDQDTELSNTLDELQSILEDYSPTLLKNDELTSFFASQINGRETHTGGINWNGTLANQALDFDAEKNYCTYGRHGDKIYSAWLSIANYPDNSEQKTLEGIFSLPIEFNLYQSFSTYSKRAAEALIEAEAKEQANWGSGNDEFAKELITLSNKLEAGDLSAVNHAFALEVLAASEQELNDKVYQIKTVLERNKALFYRETTNIEALFWSRFPTQQAYNLRRRDITSENAAHLATFNSIGEGFDTCGFGDKPITMFKTDQGGQYSFTLHETPEMKPDILGHTGVIGGTGVGKSTLIAFILANCLPYDDFKAICFDRLKGLKIFTDMFDGDYLEFPDDVELNPFLLKDTQANRMFLFSWLKRLARIPQNEDKYDAKIENLVAANFELDKEHRNFNELAIKLGRKGDELRDKFRQWMPDGMNGKVFNAPRDSFNFDKQIVTFDATHILNQEDILPVVTDYIFHKIMDQVSNNITPHVLFFDEFPRYVQEPEFADRIFEAMKEIRKKLGILILAMQNPNSIRSLPQNKGSEVINNLANLIIYPDSGATRADYVDFLGLNDKEFEWVKNTKDTRKVLFKRIKSGSSVVLDINLSNLKTPNMNMLNAFNSSVKDVIAFEKLKQTNPHNWKLKHLQN